MPSPDPGKDSFGGGGGTLPPSMIIPTPTIPPAADPDPSPDPGVTPGDPTPGATTPVTKIVPGKPETDGEINIADYGGQAAHDPKIAISDEMTLTGKAGKYSDEQISAGEIQDQDVLDPNQFDGSVAQGTTKDANAPVNPGTAGYQAATTEDKVAGEDITAAQGTLSDQSKIKASQIDVEGAEKGTTPLGKALKDFAFLDPNNVDAKATIIGQMDILQSQFKDSSGNPVIPHWASGIARNVQKMAAFKGISGTAATAAMSQAILEGTVQIAEKDAKFFQTLTLTNLNNKQQSIIQKASVLANLEMANLDTKTAVAVQNSKNFLAMDLANLDNQQQANILNSQHRIQSILEDARAINAQRLFTAESENEMNMFYDNLGAQIEQFNAAQYNAMSQFNADEANSMTQFNQQMANARDLFYRDMQFNIDIANAKWRQTVATNETQMAFEAAAFDVKTAVDISQEQLNRIWDRSDALLDYLWKSTENELDRDSALIIAQLQANTQTSVASAAAGAQKKAAFGQVIGTIAGALIGAVFS